MYNSNIKNFKIGFDIESSGKYEPFCPLNIDYDQGESLDTWYDLCSEIANNMKTALDPTWSLSFKFKKTDKVAQFIIGKEYAVGEEATVKAQLVNLLKGESGMALEFTALLSNITYSVSPEEVLQIDFDLKVADNSTFTEKPYVG